MARVAAALALKTEEGANEPRAGGGFSAGKTRE